MELSAFPALNASLNAASGILLVTGYVLVRSGRPLAHRRAMIGACLCSLLFLTSYLYYHAHHGSTPFQGRGTVRVVYFTILITHTILAAAIVPMVIRVLTHAFKGRLDRHKRLARVLFPVWLYVSVTGVVIYWMLYRISYIS